jgi:hypothetical protein
MLPDRLIRLIYGRRIQGLLLLGLEAAWPLMSKVLSQGSVVYQGRVGASGTQMYSVELLDRALEDPETAGRLFTAAALDGNATLAANCLRGLELLQSERLPEVAATLADRTEVLHCRAGCFGDYFTLAELANQSVARYRESVTRTARRPACRL